MNPELQRNLWLEAGPRKLAWVGVVLAVIYGAALVVAGAGSSPLDLARALTVVGAGVFVVAALFWGPRAAGRAIGAEVQQKTWDFQRLSVLAPWEMTLGKLAGSTALPWLAAATGLVAFNLGLAMGVRAGEALGRPAPWWTLAGIGTAVVMQAGAMAMALVGVRRARADGRPPALRLGWGNGVGALVLFWAVGRSVPGLGGGAFGSRVRLGGDHWWGIEAGSTRMFALSAAAFAVWAVVAAWRLMRLELQMQNRPWAWPGFLVFAAFWAAGFTVDGGPRLGWAAAGMVFGLGAYASAFAEPADRVRLRRWVEAAWRRDWSRLVLTVPAPWSALALGVVAVAGMISVARGPDEALLALAAFAFVVRDVGVIAFFRFGPRTRRGDFGAVLGLFLLYFVGGAVGGSLGGPSGMALFMPTPDHGLVSLAAAAVTAALVWAAAWSRIRAPEQAEV